MELGAAGCGVEECDVVRVGRARGEQGGGIIFLQFGSLDVVMASNPKAP